MILSRSDAAELRDMTTARIRRNYWLCAAQLTTCAQDRPLLDDAAATLQNWQSAYLDELVRRGEQT